MLSRIEYQIYAMAGFAAIGGFLFGYDLGVISGVITMSSFLVVFGGEESLTRGSLTSDVSGSIVGAMSIGCFVGALLGGQAGDKLSRKYSIVLFSIIFIISGILQAGSMNLTMLIISRLIAGTYVNMFFKHYTALNYGNYVGVSVGALSMIVPLYQSEISTKEIRGRLVSLQQFAITIGIAISFWTNYGNTFRFSFS